MMILLTGCEKDFDIFTPHDVNPVEATALERFLEEAAPEISTVTMDAATGGQLTLPSWGHLLIPPGALVDANQQSVTDTVQVSYREVIRPGERLSALLPAYYDDELLKPGPALELRVNTLTGQPLFLKENYPATVILPVDTLQPGSQWWWGTETDGRVSEWLAGSVSPSETEVLDLNQDRWLPAYTFQTDRLGWLQLTSEAGSSSTTDLCVLLTAGATGTNTALFAVYPGRNQAIRLDWTGNDEEPRFCGDGLPAGEELLLIALTVEEEDNFRFQIRQVTLQGEIQVEWMDPVETPKAEILDYLKTL